MTSMGLERDIPYKFKVSSMLHKQAKVFHSDSASTNDVIDVGEKALYNGMLIDTLDYLRHKQFCEKMASKTSHVKPQSLPLTSAAAKYHILHVYLQAQEWKGSAAKLHSREWGWQNCEEEIVPLQTLLPPAPEHLLRVIRYNCQTAVHSEMLMQEAQY